MPDTVLARRPQGRLSVESVDGRSQGAIVLGRPDPFQCRLIHEKPGELLKSDNVGLLVHGTQGNHKVNRVILAVPEGNRRGQGQ